jgi:hypothetical protein
MYFSFFPLLFCFPCLYPWYSNKCNLSDSILCISSSFQYIPIQLCTLHSLHIPSFLCPHSPSCTLHFIFHSKLTSPPPYMPPTLQFSHHLLFSSTSPFPFCSIHPLFPIPHTPVLHLFMLLIISGGIELNPGPLPHLLNTHPRSHHQRQNTYFIPGTLKLRP